MVQVYVKSLNQHMRVKNKRYCIWQRWHENKVSPKTWKGRKSADITWVDEQKGLPSASFTRLQALDSTSLLRSSVSHLLHVTTSIFRLPELWIQWRDFHFFFDLARFALHLIALFTPFIFCEVVCAVVFHGKKVFFSLSSHPPTVVPQKLSFWLFCSHTVWWGQIWDENL